MLRRNLVANYIGHGWTALMGLVFIPIYIKYLGIEAYGLIGVFAVVQAWLVLLDMGLKPSLGREMARLTGGATTPEYIRDLLRSVEIISAGVTALIALGIWAASGWLASEWLRIEKLPIDTVAQAIVIMGFVIALRFIEGIYNSCLIGLQRQVLYNVLNSGLATLRGAGAVAVLAWVSPTIDAFFIWHGIVSLLSLGLLAGATYLALPQVQHPARFSLSALRGVTRFAGGMLAITFFALLLTQVDKILLSKLLTLADFGYYTLASTLAGGALAVLIGPVNQAWFPRLSQLHAANDNPGLFRCYHQGAQLVSVLAGSASFVMMAFAETLLHLWTQDQALSQRVAPLLSLLVLGNLLNGLMWIPYQTQLAYGWTGLAVRINIVAVAIIVPAILWVTPRYGAEGAAWAWVCLNAGYVLIGIHFMYRRILRTEKWRWYREDVIKPLLAAGVTTLLVRWLLPEPTGTVQQLLTLTFAALTTLFFATLAASAVRREAAVSLIRHYEPNVTIKDGPHTPR
jgi:O-antigen/teichoic acid export membrane protein